MNENELQKQVLELCKQYRLRVFHAYDSRQTTGAGYPDLTIAGSRLIFAELKMNYGQLSYAQQNWKFALKAAGAEWYLWRPKDLEAGEIEIILRSLSTLQ